MLARCACSLRLRGVRGMAGISIPHADVRGAKVGGGGAGAAFSSPDTTMEDARLAPGAGDEKRAFTYFVLVRARVWAEQLNAGSVFGALYDVVGCGGWFWRM